ncbi:MAG: hypothetical protein AB7O97_08080 [Planctomycetota bacterium]
MRCLLLWQAKGPDLASTAVTAVQDRVRERFGRLWSAPPRIHGRECGVGRLVFCELPTRGFAAPFAEGDPGSARFAFATEYPPNLRRLLRRHRAGCTPSLAEFAALLEAAPDALAEAAAPFVVADGVDGEYVRVQNDALGSAQWFEYEDERIVAWTNRVMLLPALGIALRPSVEDWAARLAIGWFPGDASGYRGVRFVPGGTSIRLHRGGVERRRRDVLGRWVAPAPMRVEDGLELGRRAVFDAVADVVELAERPSVGLSGGRDSRAVVACLRAQGARFKARVRGARDNFDVIVAAELARIAGLELHTKEHSGLPPATTDGLAASIGKALLWQGGMFTTLKHKTFLAKADRGGLDGGVVNVMGQHGGIGKGDFAVKVDAAAHPPERYEELLLERLLGGAPVFLRPELLGAVRERVRAAYRRARDYGMEGRGPLHFFFLHEYVRRWGSATVNAGTGVVATPFLAPDFVRACYALPEDTLPDRPLHLRLIERHAPDWVDVPFADDLTEADLAGGRWAASGGAADETAVDRPAAADWMRSSRHHSFDHRRYWQVVGRPLIDAALREGGFWTELFDPDRARARWQDFKYGPDLLALMHLLPRAVEARWP